MPAISGDSGLLSGGARATGPSRHKQASNGRDLRDEPYAPLVDYNPSKRTTSQLLGDWAAIMRELAARDVIRTNNNPLGDIAELVVASHFGGERGTFSQAGWDVITPTGEKAQVKSLREVPGKRRSNFSPISDPDYDFVVLVIFDEDFRITKALRLDRDLVEKLFTTNSKGQRIIRWSKKLVGNPEVRPLDLSGAADWLHPVID